MNNSKQPGGDRLTPLVATLNLRGQTKMNMIKQLQIDELVKAQKAAIIFFQESHILDQTFENCLHIKANFQLFKTIYFHPPNHRLEGAKYFFEVIKVCNSRPLSGR